jgi:tRNA(Arg) A34 adenosine deaminase TadA
MLSNEDDISYFTLSFKLAEKALGLQEVPVGCIFVYNSKIIGEGHNDVNRLV